MSSVRRPLSYSLDRASERIKSWRCSGVAGWASSIARAMNDCGARWRSKFCPHRWPMTPSGCAAEEAPFIVSELLEGAELRAQLESGALPARRALEYAQQITAGLAATM